LQAAIATDTRKRRILIVEDSRSDVFLIREGIRAHIAAVDAFIVEDGSEAIKVVERAEADPEAFCPEAILLDLNLPKQNGFEVLECIRRSRRCQSTPVIVVSSSDSSRDKAETARLGANRYFRKPNNFEEYLQVGAVLNEVLTEADGKAATA
jgi:DNA-binding response OmpR family regulator